MKIQHANGTEVDTDDLSDADSILMEESKKLQLLFASYNRQLFMVGELKMSKESTSENGGTFFHVAPLDASPEKINEAYGKFWWRVNGFIHSMTNGNLRISKNDEISN